MAVRAVLAAGLLLLLALAGVTLAQSAPRPSGSNYVPEVEEVVRLVGDDRHCQEGETIPGDSAAMRILIGTNGRPAPELGVTIAARGGRAISAGRLAAGTPEGRVEIPIRAVEDTTPAARVCVARRGPGRTVLYGGGGRVRLEWVRSGEESWLALLPTVAHRFSLGRADFLGPLLLPFVALLLLASWWAAIRTVVRETET
jgi:hypothetical protein